MLFEGNSVLWSYDFIFPLIFFNDSYIPAINGKACVPCLIEYSWVSDMSLFFKICLDFFFVKRIPIPFGPPNLWADKLKKSNLRSFQLNIPLIVDDTIGSNLNINSLEHADIVFTSLTKIFSGSGDILAGSLILNPKSKWIDQFRNALNEIVIPKLSDGDTVYLEKVSRDVNQRVFEQNKACLELKKRLETHSEIKNIFHPENCPYFNSLLNSDGGYGCLLSFELNGGLNKAKKFYDSLKVSKGPSLGTKFTLVCPYVLLAHYDELDWAESFGIPSHLIRVSVGLEDQDQLWKTFSEALNNF